MFFTTWITNFTGFTPKIPKLVGYNSIKSGAPKLKKVDMTVAVLTESTTQFNSHVTFNDHIVFGGTDWRNFPPPMFLSVSSARPSLASIDRTSATFTESSTQFNTHVAFNSHIVFGGINVRNSLPPKLSRADSTKPTLGISL